MINSAFAKNVRLIEMQGVFMVSRKTLYQIISQAISFYN